MNTASVTIFYEHTSYIFLYLNTSIYSPQRFTLFAVIFGGIHHVVIKAFPKTKRFYLVFRNYHYYLEYIDNIYLHICVFLGGYLHNIISYTYKVYSKRMVTQHKNVYKESIFLWKSPTENLFQKYFQVYFSLDYKIVGYLQRLSLNPNHERSVQIHIQILVPIFINDFSQSFDWFF